MLTTEEIKRWIEEKRGVLTARSAFVSRDTYFGNDIIAPNSSREKADARGYVPVELWIMSLTEAENTVRMPEEGLTRIKIFDTEVTLKELRDLAGDNIFGNHSANWPLTKVLDIGGKMVKTSFESEEIPPIPVHVHPRKTEAYFFPPTELSPYKRRIEAITRIGLKGNVSQESFKEKLKHFGADDSMYTLLNEFPIEPMSGWTVREKVLHAPGPYITFEIQRPMDDYNLASWRLGERLVGEEREQKYAEHVLREMVTDENEFVEKSLDWERTTDQSLREKYFHKPKLLDSGDWGKRHQIFFDMFYGESWEILPGQALELKAKDVPQAGLVWSGEGVVNGNPVSQSALNEFLVVPHTAIRVENPGTETLYIYTVEPIA